MYEEHETPFDFFRFSQHGLTKLLTKSNFIISRVIKDLDAISTILILTNIYINTGITPKIKGAGVTFAFLFCFPIQVLSFVLSKFMPDSVNLYMNLIIKAKLAH